MQAEENRLHASWLPERIQQLEAERDQLLATISTLPQFDPALISDHLGYHSGYEDQAGGPADHQVTVHFKYTPYLSAIALVPAINPRERHGESYAFPKRFKVEVMEATGVWSDEKDLWTKETFQWVEVANWWEEDFPCPGRYPVYFRMNDLRVAKVRMTVPHGTQGAGQTFFALGELFLFQSVDGQPADNMSVWGPSSLDAFEVSDSFSLPPFWDLHYLYDGLTGLGIPLSEERVAADDFMVRFSENHIEHEPVRIVLDLGRTRRVGRVEFWPTEAPRDIAAPLYAFPGKILVELSNDPDFNAKKTIVVDDAGAQMYHDNLLRVMCDGVDARHVRLTFEELREEDGREILGIGEISVSEHGKVFSEGCNVSATGLPEATGEQLARLVDGNCRGRRILSETEWIKGLAQRRPLDRRLMVVNEELALARSAWRTFQLRLSILGGLALLAAMVLQRLQRRRVLKKLKLRITRDLHDEVGSNLGGISLMAEQMEGTATDAGAKEQLRDLSLMAREACASLREVVWVFDQSTIRLPDLIQKLIERAERVLRDVDFSTETSADYPDMNVSLNFKRHLIMFFSEAVNNCARHAHATKVNLAVQTDDHFLMLALSDNGCGFDMTQPSAGWGLSSMKKRARELGGEMKLKSQSGEGTSIELRVPLAILSAEPKNAYKTSN